MLAKNQYITFFLLISFILPMHLYAGDSEIISSYKGSESIFTDDIGFEAFYYLADKTVMKEIEGKITRRFYSAPEGVSAYEVVKNYEKAIQSRGGAVIYLSRDAYRFTDPKTKKRVNFMSDYFVHKRKARYNHWGYMQLPRESEDYIVGKVSTPSNDVFLAVAAAKVDKLTYYTLVTVQVEPMDMQNVTMNVLSEGIEANGKVAIYDIYFDTGKYQVKKESDAAINILAEFLRTHAGKKFLVVGHTDNTGSFQSNIKLSQNRAASVIQMLVSKHQIPEASLMPFGIGSASPKTSNSTEAGRARNRRVELVEY